TAPQELVHRQTAPLERWDIALAITHSRVKPSWTLCHASASLVGAAQRAAQAMTTRTGRGQATSCNGRVRDEARVSRRVRARRDALESGDEPIDGAILGAGKLHAALRDESGEEIIEQPHDRRIAGELVRAVALDGLDAVLLHVAGHDPGERAPQIRRKLMRRLVTLQLQGAHRFVRDLERLLEIRL